MLLVLALIACKDPGVPEGDTVDTPDDYLPPEQDAPEPALTLAEIEAAVQTALEAGWGTSAQPVMDSYNAAMVGMDTSCPAFYGNEFGYYWYDQCTAESGTEFSGYGFYYAYDDMFDEDSGWTMDGGQFYGGAQIRTESHTFEGAGGAAYIEAHRSEGQELLWQTAIQGTFAYDGDEADGTWLQSDLSPDMVVLAYYAAPYDGHIVQIDGGMSGYDDVVGSAVAFDGLYFGDAEIGWTCPEEPNGTMSVRGSDGAWYDVIFDGPNPETFEMDDPDLCDGLGTAYFRGENLGQVAIDTSLVLGWETAPW